MNIKRIFGAILTLLAIAGLIYTASVSMENSVENHDIRILIIYGVLGLLFFITGINLFLTTKDES
jgi:hypothetical protein